MGLAGKPAVFLGYSQGGRNLGGRWCNPRIDVFFLCARGAADVSLSLPPSSEIKAFATFLAAEEQMCV